jgi:hypothetical protein
MNHDRSLTNRDKSVSFLRVLEKFMLSGGAGNSSHEKSDQPSGLKMLDNTARSPEKLQNVEQ